MSKRNNREDNDNTEDASDVQFERLSPHELRELKESLLNTVAAALIQAPKASVTDPTMKRITIMVKKIAFYDPEFVLKLALYVRLDLNIRSTANYLLAVASNIKECQPYFKKYFVPSIRLPSDWLDVAATYQQLPDKDLEGKALPTCLRKAMVAKFSDFDAYQLGKYNKERTIKRKNKKAKDTKKKPTNDKPMITLKQMIRQLHISSPNLHVMCLLGKKYPMNELLFREANLPGAFEHERAGRRMKLPTAETWETLLSEKGNKASTWEELIEHKKLPFMAMLRNLRNMIFTGVHPRYHKWAQNKLSNPGAIAQSRQFPFQFFSAYEVIPRDMEHFKQLVSGEKDNKKPTKPGEKEPVKRKKKPIITAHQPTDKLFEDYRKAIDTAVKLATIHNVQPIRGSTVVFCNVGSGAREASPGAKGMGSSVRKIQEVGYLLGLMCKYVCEDCDFRIYSSAPSPGAKSHVGVELTEGTILDNMKVVANQAETLGDGNDFPYDYLEDLIRSKRRVDNFMVLSHVSMNPSKDSSGQLSQLLTKYRAEVNPDLLFVSVDLSGSGRSSISTEDKNPNDVMITGFSDQILRFIAERGDMNQVQYVEHIDEAKGLNKQVSEAAVTSPWWSWLERMGNDADQVAIPNIVSAKEWKSVRIFISSTFLDMHGERDVLTRIVFPELKERAKRHKINLYEVDLRWGITEETSLKGEAITNCLDEVDRSDIFVGILGDRYGWAPDSYDLPNHARFDWVKDYPSNRSVTELEMEHAMQDRSKKGVFFYFRDQSVSYEVPENYQRAFTCQGDDNLKLNNLKDRIRLSDYPLLDGYESKWGGLSEGKPVVTGLESFASRVFDDLWNCISSTFPEDEIPEETLDLERNYHQSFSQSLYTDFVGRKDVLDQIQKFVDGHRHQLLVLHGKPGDGKSAILAHYAHTLATKDKKTFVLGHFVGASPSSVDIRKTLWRLCSELKSAFNLEDEVPYDFKQLCNVFPSMLEQATFKGKVVVVLDAVNQLDDSINRAHGMDWFPAKLPCKFIVTTLESHATHNALVRRHNHHALEHKMNPLTVGDRALIVRTILQKYHKKLDERPMNNQMRVLLKKADAGSPLYLTVACEELRVFGVYEKVSDKIKTLGEKMPKLFDEVLQRLEITHGKELVQDVCALIYTSRYGMLSSELTHITNVTQSKWTQLFRGLAPFLKPTGDAGENQFFHQQFAASVAKRYAPNARVIQKYHVKLADYFFKVADPEGRLNWTGGDNKRAVRELPHHLFCAEKSDVSNVLTDLSFIELKIAHGFIYDLLEDYNEVTKDGNVRFLADSLSTIREFHSFVKSNSHVLQINPLLVFQQAANQPKHTAPAKAAMKKWSEHDETRSWVKWINKPLANDPCKMTLSGYQESMTAAAYSADGALIAVASRDCAIRLFDAKTGAEKSTLTGHSNWIVDLKFSPDSQQLVSGSWDDTAKVWNVGSEHCEATLKGHKRRINSVSYSSDGSFIATASWDCTIKIWSSRDYECKYTINVGERPVNCCTFTPDDKRIVAGSWDGTVKTFEVHDGNALVSKFKAHSKSVSTIAVAPSGKHLVSGGLDRNLTLWDAQAGKEIAVLTKHAKPITAVNYSHDGGHILSASADATSKVWKANLGQERRSFKVGEFYLTSCSYDPTNDQRLASGCSDCSVIVWDLTDGTRVLTMEGHSRAPACVAYSADGTMIASCSEDGYTIIWDANTGAKLQEFKSPRPVNSVAWSPIEGDQRLVSGGDESVVSIINASTGQLELPFFTGHSAAVRCVCFDHKGKLVASASRDNTVRVWDSRNGNCLYTLRGHTDWISTCCFSPNGNKLVTGSWDFTIIVWNLRNSTPSTKMIGHDAGILQTQYSRDGKTVMSCSFDRTIKIWDAESGTEITTLDGHSEPVHGFSISPDGRSVASVSDDHTIKLWDPLSATEVQALVGHANAIRSASFSPANKQIVTTGDDRTVKVWDVGLQSEESSSSGYSFGFSSSSSSKTEEVQHEERITGHSSCVNSVKISPDGKQIVSSSDDATFALWDIATSTKLRTYCKDSTDDNGEVVLSESAFKGADFSSDGRVIATASDSGEICLWDTRSKNQIKSFNGHTGPATSVSLIGETLASTGWDNMVRILDTRTYKETQLSGHSDWILSCQVSQDKKYVVSGGWDKTVRLWDIASRQSTLLSGHSLTVTSVSYSDEHKLIASASYDSLVKIWSTSGRLEKNFAGHKGRVNAVSFAPRKDNIVLTGGSDNTVKLWDLKSNRMTNEFVCQGPVTSIDVKRTSNSDNLLMVFGDSIGNLYISNLVSYGA
eukprot:TRINITY_DN693_c0_g1_i1.p1 TRINITY_DN693_c0_g1~~TRINITY_DN693_c0_g1_i1.p1  ORF type:complete len:2289 (+),score=635.01 TRINITY_DN693_c0_g1_i1:128-6994(+)